MGIGSRMKAVLRERKMTIKKLSSETGVSLNTLYSITKRDAERADGTILQQIAVALEVPIGYLCDEIEIKGTIPLRHGLLREKIFEYAEAANISREDLCTQVGLPFDEWYRWCEQSSTSFLKYLPQIANVLDVPRKALQKYVDGDYLNDISEERLLSAFHKLNEWGQEVALERIEELGKIEDYKK